MSIILDIVHSCFAGFRLGILLGVAFAAVASGARAESIADDPPAHGAPFFVGEAATARPLPPKAVVPHPFLAEQSSIHVDLYNSDTTDLATPLGRDPVVTSRRFADIGACLNFTFDALGRLFAFCGVPRGDSLSFELTALDPETLEKRSAFPLLELTIPELVSLPLDLGYMVMNSGSQFIAINRENQVLWIGPEDETPESPLVVHHTRDFTEFVPVARDKVASVVPDYENRLLYLTLGKHDADGNTTTPALFGILDDAAGVHDRHEFAGEIVENGLAVDQDGAFVLTDHALYGFRYDATAGRLEQTFREPYDRGTGQRGGQISLGSGSTPTLLGDRYIAITDHADGQQHLLVYDRRPEPDGGPGRRLVCDVPVFEPGASINENSVVGSGRSIVVQNWYGAPDSILSSDHRAIVPGLARFDIREDGSGCDQIWYKKELATPATMKLSTATGLLYATMLDQGQSDVDAYYLVAADFETGRTVYRVRLGVGPEANIQFSPTYVGVDGAIYQPVRSGVIKLEDGAASSPERASSAASGCSVAPRAGGSPAPLMLWTVAVVFTAAWRMRRFISPARRPTS